MENASSRPLRGRQKRIAAAVLAVLLSCGAAGAEELAGFLESYRAAADRRAVGVVRGSVFVESRRPEGEATPLPGVAILLVPPAPRLLESLEAIKNHARDSAARYLGAAGEVGKAQETYEMALRQGGAGDLVFRTMTDAAGRFEFARVPAGEWVLLGRHELLHRRTPRKIPPEERGGRLFLLEPPPAGYRAVTHWLVKLTVEGGGDLTVTLHDRNSWFTGVLEEKAPGITGKKNR